MSATLLSVSLVWVQRSISTLIRPSEFQFRRWGTNGSQVISQTRQSPRNKDQPTPITAVHHRKSWARTAWCWVARQWKLSATITATNQQSLWFKLRTKNCLIARSVPFCWPAKALKWANSESRNPNPAKRTIPLKSKKITTHASNRLTSSWKI